MSGVSPISPSAAAGPTQGLPPWMQTAAQGGAFGNIGNLGAFNLYNPQQYGGFTQQIAGGVGAGPQVTGGAQTAQLLGGQGISSEQSLADALTRGAQQLRGAGQNVMQTAFDPQQALYNRTLQQSMQQWQAANAQAGVGTTPYGAGLINQDISNFNMDWQNQQLGRQLAGLQGFGGAEQTGAGLRGQAANIYAGLPQQAYQAGQYPYAAGTQLASGGMGALGQQLGYGQQGSNIAQQQIQDYLALLGLQPLLSGAQNQTARTMAGLQAQELGQLGSGIAGIFGLPGQLSSFGSGMAGLGGMGGGMFFG